MTCTKGCIYLSPYEGRWGIMQDYRSGGAPEGVPEGCRSKLNVVCEAKMTYRPPSTDINAGSRGEYKDCPSRHDISHGKYCYRPHNYGATWYDAEYRCNRDRSHLASIHDPAENAFIESIIQANIDADSMGRIHAWVGMYLVPGQLPGRQ